eukprot:6185744-Pleurochrysis_carterae.AAC.2
MPLRRFVTTRTFASANCGGSTTCTPGNALIVSLAQGSNQTSALKAESTLNQMKEACCLLNCIVLHLSLRNLLSDRAHASHRIPSRHSCQIKRLGLFASHGCRSLERGCAFDSNKLDKYARQHSCPMHLCWVSASKYEALRYAVGRLADPQRIFLIIFYQARLFASARSMPMPKSANVSLLPAAPSPFFDKRRSLSCFSGTRIASASCALSGAVVA